MKHARLLSFLLAALLVLSSCSIGMADSLEDAAEAEPEQGMAEAGMDQADFLQESAVSAAAEETAFCSQSGYLNFRFVQMGDNFARVFILDNGNDQFHINPSLWNQWLTLCPKVHPVLL